MHVESVVDGFTDRWFEAVYVDAVGVESQVSWEQLGRVALEWGRPVRRFPSYRGQRNYPGLYWSATMGAHVGYESWVGRDHLVALPARPAAPPG